MLINSMLMIQSLKNKVIKAVKNESGADGGVITGILFAAIIILAVIATKGDITTVFSNLATQFSTWISGKINTILS